MNPGFLNRRITIQSLTTIKDELGQSIEEEWKDYKRVWCMIKTVQGREYIEASATQNERIVRFVIRYIKGIDSSMRILYDGRIFEIQAPPINDDEQNQTLTIITKEKVV